MGGIRVEGLTKRFKSEIVLDNVSLQVPAGGTLALFGPSGAGKTVLLRCIAGAVEPDEGRIYFGERDVTDLPPDVLGIGMAFQNFALFPHMTAAHNIASPLDAARVPKDELEDRVSKVATLLKIDHVLSHAPRELSNGQKQRTALARALVAEPEILLLDDPLRNVDAKLRFEMRLELPRLLAGRGATAIYVTQDYKEAMALGDRIAVLDAGRIAQFGTPEEIYLWPNTIEIARLFGDLAVNLLDVTPAVDEEGVTVRISDERVSLGRGFEMAADMPAVLGLRPEALSFADAGFPVTVEAETAYNEKAVTLAKTVRGHEILVSRPAETPGPAEGSSARVVVDPASSMLFERETGRRIERTGTETAVAA